MPLGGGRLQPLASLDYSRIDGEAFAELGDTGLELVGEASRRSRLAAALGARYSRHWRRLWLELEAQRHQALQAAAPVHAGFRAAPAVRFRLPDLQPRGGATLGLRLGGPLEHRWEWDLACLREDGRFEARPGLARGFWGPRQGRRAARPLARGARPPHFQQALNRACETEQALQPLPNPSRCR